MPMLTLVLFSFMLLEDAELLKSFAPVNLHAVNIKAKGFSCQSVQLHHVCFNITERLVLHIKSIFY